MKKLFLNFDFYGSGNIGDDLMLDGFVKGLQTDKYEINCCVRTNTSHLKKRFPQINFFGSEKREEIGGNSEYWIGVGDTPVQMTSGEWFLIKLQRDNQFRAGKNIKSFFTGIGAEREALKKKSEFQKVLEEIDHIWTRDLNSTKLLTEKFEIDKSKVTTSSDLANISLSKIFDEKKIKNEKRKFDTGICYFDEDQNADNIKTISQLGIELQKKKRKTYFFSNSISDGKFESVFFERMFSGVKYLISKKPEFYQPDYFGNSSTESLVSHFKNVDTVISSRYHVLLTAAWAGCRIVSLERSSKVTALCDELQIPEVKKPYDLNEIIFAIENAPRAERKKLSAMEKNAADGIRELESKL